MFKATSWSPLPLATDPGISAIKREREREIDYGFQVVTIECTKTQQNISNLCSPRNPKATGEGEGEGERERGWTFSEGWNNFDYKTF